MKNIIFINLMVLLIILSGCSPVIKENADTIQLWEQKKSQLNISYNENNYPIKIKNIKRLFLDYVIFNDGGFVMKQIVIGSDHAGYKMKQFLIQQLQDAGYDVEDKGTYSEDSVDAGAYAIKVCEDVANNLDTKYGILICGTGIGMSMMANKVKGIRASLVSDLFSAEMTRAHNDANVLCMGARIISEYMAWEFTKVWLSTEHLGEKYAKRVEAMMNYEKNR